MQDAYRASGPYMGDPYRGQYNRLAAAAEARANTASLYHEQMGHRIFVYGAFEEGNPVFEVEEGRAVPNLVYSTEDPRGCKKIGHIFKVGGRWTIEETCPGHRWNYDASRGDFRDEPEYRGMLPAKVCGRCHHFEFADPQVEEEYQANLMRLTQEAA